jgi:ABC-type polysaccharide/polyol phosphate transport system ATPase subunit
MRARRGFSVAFQANPGVLLIDVVLGVGDSEFRKNQLMPCRLELNPIKQ